MYKDVEFDDAPWICERFRRKRCPEVAGRLLSIDRLERAVPRAIVKP